MTSTTQTIDKIVIERLNDFRTKLLDLTGRNPLLNYKLSQDKAKTFVRLIDELPDFLYGEFRQGKKLTFKPLPPLDNEPHDEKNEKFQSAYRRAKLTDEIYIKEIEATADKEDNFDDIVLIERRLKDRIRAELGMPPVKDLKPLSNPEWARQNGLEPQYDLPMPRTEVAQVGRAPERHSDEWMQTLHLPKELEQKLQGLKRYINTDINETGVNTFYAAFGFLQWYDEDKSDKPCFAPLLLLQLDQMKEKKTRHGEIFYSIEASEEEPQYNLPLAEKLRSFGLSLPELTETDTPESYMQKVEKLIKNKPRWRVRRFITLGRFQFARLVMYHDLDPAKWPQGRAINDNPIIKSLLSGHKSGSDSSIGTGDPSVYDIDTDEEVEAAAPVLITEADSSQHSAIVDALKGKNLVIKGPPGTGKSQTITNLIANAIAKNKKVLFIAEKMAALDVVYSRLKHAGLGDFCLELHSTKSKLKDVRNDLERCLSNRQSAMRPKSLSEKIQQLKEAKLHLRQYSDILNSVFGKTEKTIHDILWDEQVRRNIITSQPAYIKGLRIKNVDSLTLPQIKSFHEELKSFESLAKENSSYTSSNHPWKGVGVAQISGLKIAEIIQAAEEALETTSFAISFAHEFEERHGWQVSNTLDKFEGYRKAWLELHETTSKLKDFNYTLLENLVVASNRTAINQLVSQIEEYKAQAKLANETIRNPEKIVSKQDEIKSLCKRAQNLNIDGLTAKEIREDVERQKQTQKLWEAVEQKLSFISWKVLEKEEASLKETIVLLDGIKLLSKVNKEALLRRSDETLDEANVPIINSAIEKLLAIRGFENGIGKKFDLKSNVTDGDLDAAIYELSDVNIISYLKPDFYKARKLYKTIRETRRKIDFSNAAQELRQFKQYKADLASFVTDARYSVVAGRYFEGTATDFSLIRSVNDWAQEVRKSFSGFDISGEKVKNFLLKSQTSDIEAVLAQFSQEEIATLDSALIDVGTREISCKEHIAYQKEIAAKGISLAEILEQLGVSQNATYANLHQVLSVSLIRMKEIQNAIDSERTLYGNLIGNKFAGLETNIHTLRNTVLLAEIIQNSVITDNAKLELYKSNVEQVSEQICSDICSLQPHIQKVGQRLKTLAELSAMDFKIYAGANDYSSIPLEVLKAALQLSLADGESLSVLVKCNDFMKQADTKPYGELIKAQLQNQAAHDGVADIFDYLVYRSLCDKAMQQNGSLDNRNLLSLDQIRAKFQELDKEIIKLQSLELSYQVYKIKPPEGKSAGYVSDYSDMGLIRHQVHGNARSIPLRRFLNRAGAALQVLKPCFLMSPLSVAQYIGPDSIKFDMVVIDEASQMCPEDALGAIARCGQIIVVGDPQQLPPTSFFQKQASVSTDNYEEEDRLDNESILDLAYSRYFPPRELLWHYRSRHESLIAFSNAHFYDEKLIVFPSPEGRSDRFGVSSQYIGGLYSSSCNVDEAKAVVEAARQFMRDNPDKSLGIATMNSQQRDLIDEEMHQLFNEDKYAEAYRQKWEGTLERFFVKNLESVQGDERDTIFISTVYGPSVLGQKPAQRFGPINGKFGHRRLNVLFTRAKHNLVLFTSLKPDDIVVTLNSSLGLRAFKGYLEYAETGKIASGVQTDKSMDSDFEVWVRARLEAKGYEVVPQIGVAGYFIDLGLKHPEYPYGYLLGIECDGAMYHSSKSARDRDRIRQQVLEGLGWSIYRIWSTSWFHDPDKEVDKLIAHIEKTFSEKMAKRNDYEARHKEFIAKFHKEIQPTLFEVPLVRQIISTECTEQYEAANDNIIEVFDTVTFEFLDSQDQESMTVTLITGTSEASIGHINQHTAIGQALIGSKLNEEVEIEFPRGARPVLIKDIKKYRAV